MSALTYEVADLNSPVCVWLRSKFPDHKEIQAGYRTAAGTARVLPSPEVALQTQGAAIDWWIRFLADPAPTLSLVLSGLAEIQGLPCFRAGMRLVAGLGGIGQAAATLTRREGQGPPGTKTRQRVTTSRAIVCARAHHAGKRQCCDPLVGAMRTWRTCRRR
jgi:hypothetical protein